MKGKKIKQKTKKVWSMDKTLVGTEESAGTVIFQRFFENLCKVHRKIPVLESLFSLFSWSFTPVRVFANGFVWISKVLGGYFPSWSLFREGGRVEKLFEDSPWMFWRLICTCEGRYYKINYKYQGCKLTKTKGCCKSISCSFICGFILILCSNVTI